MSDRYEFEIAELGDVSGYMVFDRKTSDKLAFCIDVASVRKTVKGLNLLDVARNLDKERKEVVEGLDILDVMRDIDKEELITSINILTDEEIPSDASFAKMLKILINIILDDDFIDCVSKKDDEIIGDGARSLFSS